VDVKTDNFLKNNPSSEIRPICGGGGRTDRLTYGVKYRPAPFPSGGSGKKIISEQFSVATLVVP
jgi:hypothetical protein